MADVDKSELVLLTFSIEDTSSKLSWKHAKEFGYQGSMYDIVETQIDGDSVSFWCWWDFKETKLNKQLANVLDEVLNQNPANNQKRQHLKQFYKSLYFVSYDASIGVNSGKKLLYNPYSNLYQSEKPSTPQPPPKAIV